MRRPRRTQIPKRRRVFLGCEGQSEVSYAALLSRIDDARSKSLFIDNVDLGGGDPLFIVEAALRQIRDRENKRGAYEIRAVILDGDTLGRSAERDREAHRLLANNQIMPIWQQPCHEALLLRHLPDCATRRPSTTLDAMTQLRARWSQYERPMSAIRLAERLNLEAIDQAASVETELHNFLARLRL